MFPYELNLYTKDSKDICNQGLIYGDRRLNEKTNRLSLRKNKKLVMTRK